MGGARSPPPHHPPWAQSDQRAAGNGIPPTVGCSGSVSAAAMVKTARSICGALRIDEALHSMRLRPEAVQGTARALRSLGFDAAGDLQLLLPSGPEQTEPMEELRARGVSVSTRRRFSNAFGSRGIGCGSRCWPSGMPASSAQRCHARQISSLIWGYSPLTNGPPRAVANANRHSLGTSLAHDNHGCCDDSALTNMSGVGVPMAG
eukprot:SAG31_NODE_674_length_12909_cov_25.961124_8_plen_205_part_00